MIGVSNLFLALLNAAAFILCVLFLAYVVSVLPTFLRHREVRLGDRDDFHWHILIPCLNEEKVIVDTVEHLVDTFPEAQIWCVDDNSDDSTPQLLDWLTLRHQNVHVVSRRPPNARQGKGAALNAAWKSILEGLSPDVDHDKVIIGVVDGDGRLESFCPDVIAGPTMFGDPQVGAVQIQVRITEDVDGLVATDIDRLARGRGRDGGQAKVGRDPLLVHLQDLEFAGPIAAMQFFRRRTGSVAMGGNGQFTRLSTLNVVAANHGGPWHGALLEDFELGLHVLLSGYRSEYCHDTFVAQSGLTEIKPLIRQRTRWSQGNIQCLRYLWKVLNNKHIPLSGALEIAHYLYVPFSQILGSIVFPLSAVVLAGFALSEPEGTDAWLLKGAWGLIPLVLVFGVLPHAMWGLYYRSHCARMVTRKQALLMALFNVGYGYLLQICAWKALIRVLRGRHDWAKTKRAGEYEAASIKSRPEPALVNGGVR